MLLSMRAEGLPFTWAVPALLGAVTVPSIAAWWQLLRHIAEPAAPHLDRGAG